MCQGLRWDDRHISCAFLLVVPCTVFILSKLKPLHLMTTFTLTLTNNVGHVDQAEQTLWWLSENFNCPNTDYSYKLAISQIFQTTKTSKVTIIKYIICVFLYRLTISVSCHTV